MKMTKGSVHVHYNIYSRSGSTYRRIESDPNPFRGVDFHRIQRLRRSSPNRRMLQNRILQRQFDQSPDRNDNYRRESRDQREDRSPRRQELQTRLETLHLSDISQRLRSPHRKRNPFVRSSASPFKRYRSNHSPSQQDSISERSLTPFIRKSPQRSDDERERSRSRSHGHYTPTRRYRRRKSVHSRLNPFLRDSISKDRSVTSNIRHSPQRSDNERETSVSRRYNITTSRYRRLRSFRSHLNPFRRNSISRERSLTPLIRRSSHRERSLSRRPCSPPRRYRRQNIVSRIGTRRLLIRRPHRSQLLAYSRRINNLRIIRRNTSKELFQSITGEIRALTKLSRAVRGLPLNKYKRRPAGRYRERVQYNQESEDEACLEEPDLFEFLD